MHLHVAGEGRERAALEARACQLGVDDQVTFHGWIPNRQLWDLIQRMDIFVHPGRWPEPCGRSVLEALALGLPTIVSDIGGPPWLVGPYGRTFAPGDSVGLAAQIDALCAEYDRALETARQGIERAAEFDYRAWAPKIAEVYADLLRAGRAGSEHDTSVMRSGALPW